MTTMTQYALASHREYVNIADIFCAALSMVFLKRSGLTRIPDFELIELFFFAYRDFVGEPDRMLAKHGFGRAHHRALHFINRRPGLNVAELLDILEITKQSLARVLKELVQAGFVEQRAGPDDRRQRQLFLSERGHALAAALANLQGLRMAQGLEAIGPEQRGVVAQFLNALIDGARKDNL
jgi:DNA-binding MarR family transcriptional regulator